MLPDFSGFDKSPLRSRFFVLLLICWFVFLRAPQRWLKTLMAFRPRGDLSGPGRIAVQVFAEARFSGLWAPVVRLLGLQKTVLLTSNRGTLPIDWSDYASVNCDDMPFSLLEFFRHTTTAIRTLRRPLRDAMRGCGLESGSELLMLHELVGWILPLMQIRAALRLTKPSAVLLLYDQGVWWGGLALVAEQMGIPSFTFTHGAFGAYSASDFAPLNARYILAWGDHQRELLARGGVDEKRILVTGYPRFDSSMVRRRVRDDMAPEPAVKPAILVGFTTLAQGHRHVWSQSLIELHRLLPEYRLVCRLHPSTKTRREQFKELTEHGEGLTVTESHEMSLNDCISESEAVLVHTSTLALDALLMGKPLFVYDSYDSGVMDVSYDMVEQGAAVYATTAKEMAARIREYLGNNQKREDLISRGREFTRKSVSYVGQEAVRRTVRAILERTGSSS